jgi:hypothetical protein
VPGSSGQAAFLGADDAYIGYVGSRLGAKEGTITFKYKPIPNLASAYATRHAGWTDYGQYKPPQSGFLLDTVGWNAAPAGSFALVLDPSAAGGLSFGVWDGSKWHYVNWKTPAGWKWDSERWYEVGVAWGTTGMGVFVDGQLMASIPDVVSVSSANAWFLGQAPGYWPYGPHTMMGTYDDVRVYGVSTLSASTTSASPGAPLVSQALEPSTADQTVSYQNQVKVTLPGGTLDSKQTLTISPAPALPPQTFKGLVGLGGFDISMGGAREFKNDIFIEIAYDPAKVVSDLPPEKALVAAYWGPDQKTWVISPALVDTQKNVVIVRTDHLSSWQLHYIARGYGVRETDHFTIVYDPKAWPEVGPTPTPTGGKVRQEPVNFANQMGIYLEHAWSQYLKAGYLPRPNDKKWRAHETYIRTGPPEVLTRSHPNLVYEPPRLLVFIDQNTRESQTVTLTGSIYLKFDYDSMDQVRHDSAHELFHSFQMESLGAPWYLARHWWVDATADYVADKVAWDNLGTMSKVHVDYLREPLTTVDEVHEYDTARFIDYLVQKGVTFKELWDQSVKSFSNDMVQVLEDYVLKKTATTLHDHYREFAAYILFDGSGPLDMGAAKSLRFSPVKEDKAPKEFAADSTEIAYPFSLKGGYTAKVWTFTVNPPGPTTDKRRLTIELTGGGLPSAAEVEANIYLLKNDQRPQGGVKPEGIINALKKSMDLSVGKDDVVYIIALNTGDSDQSLTVKVSKVPTGTFVLVKREVGEFGDPKRNTGTVSGSTAKVPFIAFQGEVSSWTCSWPEPPPTLETGQKWGGTVTVSDAGSQASESYSAVGGADMGVSWTQPGAGPGSIKGGGGGASVSGIVGAVAGRTSAPQKSFSVTIPEDALSLHISARCQGSTSQPDGKGGESGKVAGVDYYYELRK